MDAIPNASRLAHDFANLVFVSELPDPDKGEAWVELPPPPWLVEDPAHGLPPDVEPPKPPSAQPPLPPGFAIIELPPR